MKMEQLIELRKRVNLHLGQQGKKVTCVRTYNNYVDGKLICKAYECDNVDGLFTNETLISESTEKISTIPKTGIQIEDLDETTKRIIEFYKGKILNILLVYKNDQENPNYLIKGKEIYNWNFNGNIANLYYKEEYEVEYDEELNAKYKLINFEKYQYDEDGDLIRQIVTNDNKTFLDYKYEYNEDKNIVKGIKCTEDGNTVFLIEEYYDNKESVFAYNGENGYQIIAKISDNLTICEDYYVCE